MHVDNMDDTYQKVYYSRPRLVLVEYIYIFLRRLPLTVIVNITILVSFYKINYVKYYMEERTYIIRIIND